MEKDKEKEKMKKDARRKAGTVGKEKSGRKGTERKLYKMSKSSQGI